MSTAAKHLAHQLRVAYGAARLNLRGIPAADALRIPEGGGSSANWIVGHIVLARRMIHGHLGIEPVEGTQRLEPYGRGSTAPTGDEALPLSDLIGMWKASQQAVEAALAEATDERLATPLEASDARMGDTVGSALAFLAFHEGYHVGQLGITRRRLGLEGAIA